MSINTRHSKVSIGDGSTTGTSLATIKKGDLLLADKYGNVINTAAAAGALKKDAELQIISCVKDGNPVKSSVISGMMTASYLGQDYVAKTEQVTFLGFDGTSGDGIQSEADTSYRLRTIINDDYRIGHRQTVINASYTTGASTTAEDLAYNIAFIFGQKEYEHNYAENFVKLERVSDGTRTAFAATITVEKDSKVVACAGHGLAVGQIIKIKGASYVIAEVDTNEFTLDLKYKGETETIATSDSDSGSYASVTKWGFKLTGLEIDSVVEMAENDPLDNYEWVNFKAIFGISNDAQADAYVAKETTTKGSPGQGYWKQVAELEQESRYERGASSPIPYYLPKSGLITDPSLEYGSIVIDHSSNTSNFIDDVARVPMTTQIFIPTGSDQADDSGDNFLAILNAYFNGVVGFSEIATM